MTPTGSLRTVLGRVAAGLAMAAALLLGGAAPASAHAYLERTNPADGSVIAEAPDRLTLSFSEHVVLEATTIEVVDGEGHVIALGDLALETVDADDTEVPSMVSARLPDLPRDAYRVRWSTLSSDDLHRTSGFFVFGVDTEVRAAGFHEPAPRMPESGLRWLLLLGFAVALGSVLVGRLGPLAPRDRRRLDAAGRGGAAAAVAVSFLLVADQVLAGGLSWHDLSASGYVARWGVRELGLLVLLIALLWSRGRPRGALVLLGASAAALGTALLGHAGADPGTAYTRVLATAVHLLAMLTWVGGVLCLAVLLRPVASRPGHGELAARAVLRGFGRPAATLLGLGVATGVYLSSATVVSVDAALGTTYGRALVLKVGLAAAMVLLAWGNHRRLRGRHDLDLPRRGVLTEALTAVLVLGATAVLTSAQPATESVFLTPPAVTAGPVSGDVADLHVAVDVAPNRPGVNVVSIDVFDTRRPAPSKVTAVHLTVDGMTLAAVPLGDGRWTVADVDLAAGRRELVVTATRPGLRDEAWGRPWTLGAGRGARTPVVSTAALRGPLRGLAGLVLAVWLVALLVTRRRGPASRTASSNEVSRPTADPRPRTEAPLRDRSPAP